MFLDSQDMLQTHNYLHLLVILILWRDNRINGSSDPHFIEMVAISSI